jgi:hypothetical protein
MIRWLCKLALAPARLQLPSPSNHEVKFAAASGRFQKQTHWHSQRKRTNTGGKTCFGNWIFSLLTKGSETGLLDECPAGMRTESVLHSLIDRSIFITYDTTAKAPLFELALVITIAVGDVPHIMVAVKWYFVPTLVKSKI